MPAGDTTPEPFDFFEDSPQEEDGSQKSLSIRGITPLGLLGVALCLAFLGVMALSPLMPGEQDLDGDEFVRTVFRMDGTPLGWELESARALRGGKVIYSYENADAEPPGALPEDPPPDPSVQSSKSSKSRGRGRGRGGRGDGDKKRWSRLAVGEADQPPRRVALVKLSSKEPEEELRKLFAGLRFRDLEEVGERGGLVPIDAGRFDWDNYEAPYIHIRHLYEEDDKPTFHETVRVNLTVDREPWVAILEWDPRLPADVEWAKSALEDLAPR